MSSSVIPDENSAGEFDNLDSVSDDNSEPDFLAEQESLAKGKSLLRNSSNFSKENEFYRSTLERDYYKRYLTMADAETAKKTGKNEFESEYNASFDQIKKNTPDISDIEAENMALGSMYRTSYAKKKQDDYYVSNRLAQYKRGLTRKYSADSKDRKSTQKMVDEEFNRTRQRLQADISKKDPSLTPKEVQDLAERAMIESDAAGSIRNLLSDQELRGKLGNLAKEKAKQLAKQAVQKTINAALPGIGFIVNFLIFNRIGRLILLFLCLCVFFMFAEVYQTISSENKLQSVIQSAQLADCAGLPADLLNPTQEETTKIFKCLAEQKVKEYTSQQPKPE